jgi:hypothetical protein
MGGESEVKVGRGSIQTRLFSGQVKDPTGQFIIKIKKIFPIYFLDHLWP